MTRLRRILLAVALGTAAALPAGCGIPNDREPTDLEPVGATSTTVQP